MTRIIRLPALLLMAVLLSCSSGHLIGDKRLRNSVADDYRARYDTYGSVRGDLFGFADTIGDGELREAVTFLLAYMPLSDLAVYEPDYLVSNASFALRARKEMPWGSAVPDDIFLSFVLPTRVNNENPDDFRTVIYDELKARIYGLGPLEAALEVNRWCHEKVAYQAADSRTSAPLATMLSARGRCGEESTFTVSALRTVGIPARQVYTPRWAHTDDNHAWVEFWVDGSWHYLGACEPESVPDRGWFTEPARRAMLVHTKAFGRYRGNEPVIRSEGLFTEINTLDRYADTKRLKVRVTGETGEPVPGAMAAYMIYNYAEFYPLARIECDDRGECSLRTGYGTLLIWADDGERSGFVLTAPADTLAVVTISSVMTAKTVTADLQVPPVPDPLPGVNPELVRMNNILLRKGDSLRTEYISSWMKDVSADEIAKRSGLPAGAVDGILKTSMGNYRAVSDFLSSSGDRAGLALRLLANISEKDLRDTPRDVLEDHLLNSPAPATGTDTALYDRYVLSPRISNELLSPFRSAFGTLPAELLESFRSDPSVAVPWIDTTIAINVSENHYATPLVPGGVLRLRKADSHSRDIFFVALCRSLGYPSRLAPGTGRPQYQSDGKWHDVWFAGETKPSDDNGFVTFVSGAGDGEQEPQYHTHFTLARVESGRFRTLDYGYGSAISMLPSGIPLAAGTYMLTTGNRDDNGNVLAEISFIEIKPGEEISVTVSLRELPVSNVAGGKISLETPVMTTAGETVSLSSLADRGLVLAWLEPGREPTRHLLNDLPGLKKQFDEWGGWIVFLTDTEKTRVDFTPESVAGTPENTLFASDPGLKLLGTLTGSNTADRPMPVVICCNSDGDVLFSSEGYRIGTGQLILKKVSK